MPPYHGSFLPKTTFSRRLDLNNLLRMRSSIVSLNLSLLSRIPNLAKLTMHSNSLLHETHLRSESRMRNPFAGMTGVNFLQHAIDLLERETLGFWDEEVGEEDGDDAEGSPHEEDLGGEVGILLVD
jgi:hypothetical protein